MAGEGVFTHILLYSFLFSYIVPAVTYSALVAASLTVGYWAGTQWSRYNRASPSTSGSVASPGRETSEKKTSLKKARDSDSDDSEEDDPEENLGAVKPDNVEDCKLVRSPDGFILPKYVIRLNVPSRY